MTLIHKAVFKPPKALTLKPLIIHMTFTPVAVNYMCKHSWPPHTVAANLRQTARQTTTQHSLTCKDTMTATGMDLIHFQLSDMWAVTGQVCKLFQL